jgi:uncharacterized protein (TIGR00255 family)
MTAANPAVMSMTAFAARSGGMVAGLPGWTWDLRSVNARGLDLRLRLPDGIDGLEAAVRSALQARLVRGSVTLTLKLAREGGGEGLRINPAGLAAAVVALAQVEAAAGAAGLALRPPSPAEIVALRGVAETAAPDADPEPLRRALIADLAPLLDAFAAMRAHEGGALAAVVRAQLDTIAGLVAEARVEAEARRDRWAETLREQMGRVLGAEGADPARIAQELAMIAVRADVTEEIDRLGAHVAQARALLDEGGAVGRRLDFLTQEFLREANTLCSKAQGGGLTRIGLDLKAVIEQMREQVQNIE